LRGRGGRPDQYGGTDESAIGKKHHAIYRGTSLTASALAIRSQIPSMRLIHHS
jgi:hypothetical protein